MERREFLGWITVGMVASSLPMAIAAVAENDLSSEVKGNTRADGFQTVGTVTELNQKGQILNKKSPVGKILVVRNANNTLLAVNPTCSHDGCTVKWSQGDSKYLCPCHSAEFNTQGQVLKGPPKKPLKLYQAKIEGNSVLVKAV